MYSFGAMSTPAGNTPPVVNTSGDSSFTAMIQRQNTLIMEMLKKQECMNDTIIEFKDDLKETRSRVDSLSEILENKKDAGASSSSKRKRKYPSSLTVCKFANLGV